MNYFLIIQTILTAIIIMMMIIYLFDVCKTKHLRMTIPYKGSLMIPPA